MQGAEYHAWNVLLLGGVANLFKLEHLMLPQRIDCIAYGLLDLIPMDLHMFR